MSAFCSTWHLPTTIHFGPEVINQVRLTQGSQVAMVVSGSLSKTEKITALYQRLQKDDIHLQILSRSGGEPDSSTLDILFDQMAPSTGAVLGIGGGSTLDTAKFLAMLSVSGGKSADYDLGRRPVTGALPLYLMPTTMGSGSEATPYAVATNSNTRRKFTVTHPTLFPTACWVDPTLCLGLNHTTLVAGGLDTLVHCLEAALNAHKHPLVDPLALQGMQLVTSTLPKALKNQLEPQFAENLAKASLFGGMAIAHSRTGLVHTLAVALAEFLPTAHGTLNGWLLPEVLRFNASHYQGKLARFMLKESVRSSDAIAIRELLDWLQPLLPGPPPWDARNWSPTDIDHLVDRVLQDKGLPLVNPRPITRENLTRLLEGVITNHAHR